RLVGTSEPGARVELRDGSGRLLGATTAGPDGGFTLRPEAGLADGEHELVARSVDAAGNASADGPALGLRVDAHAPASPALALLAADDTGIPGDGVTSARRPR